MSYFTLAILILQFTIGLSDTPPVGGDLSGDGTISAYDASLALQRHARATFRRTFRFDI